MKNHSVDMPLQIPNYFSYIYLSDFGSMVKEINSCTYALQAHFTVTFFVWPKRVFFLTLMKDQARKVCVFHKNYTHQRFITFLILLIIPHPTPPPPPPRSCSGQSMAGLPPAFVRFPWLSPAPIYTPQYCLSPL